MRVSVRHTHCAPEFTDLIGRKVLINFVVQDSFVAVSAAGPAV